MAWQPKRWTTRQLEERRLAAGRLLRQGRHSQAEVARRMGVSEAAVSQWARRLDEAGGSTHGLKAYGVATSGAKSPASSRWWPPTDAGPRASTRATRRAASPARTSSPPYAEDFRLERLPGYAPDLNPEEGCNGVVKTEPRNTTPASVAELRARPRADFVRLGWRHEVLLAFFHHASLSLDGLP